MKVKHGNKSYQLKLIFHIYVYYSNGPNIYFFKFFGLKDFSVSYALSNDYNLLILSDFGINIVISQITYSLDSSQITRSYLVQFHAQQIVDQSACHMIYVKRLSLPCLLG